MNLGLEARVHRAVLALVRQDIATAAHDCSDGGLAVTLAEMAIAGDKGLEAPEANLGPRADAALFGEAQSRIVVTIRPERRGMLEQIARAGDVPFARIGRVTAGPPFRFGPIDLPLELLRDTYEGGLEWAIAPRGNAAEKAPSRSS
jgi:phosphoribosylformylglycinamidine synthase